MVGIIDNGDNMCYLGAAFKITKAIRSTKGPAAYLSSSTISSKLVQGVTTVLNFLGKPVCACICVGYSSAQE